ncbi:MAG: TIGR04255 family protein [Bacilli bacterium]|nr:TIGR04255 family protein [Bacilli bacterium]
MSKNVVESDDLKNNNTLINVILRTDFFKIDIEKIIEKFSENLLSSENYKYKKINNYGIKLDISDPQKLVTQDFISQKVTEVNSHEFSTIDSSSRFILNENFFIFERKGFNDYEGSSVDIKKYLELLEIVTSGSDNLKIKRIGLRKINNIFMNHDLKNVKKVIKDKFIFEISEESCQRFQTVYTPLFGRDGYNLTLLVDDGKMMIENTANDVYRSMIDIDYYCRTESRFEKISDIKSVIEQLKKETFKIYMNLLTDEMLKLLQINDSKEFYEESNKMGILRGVNYGYRK